MVQSYQNFTGARYWACPICKKSASHLYVDGLQCQILNELRTEGTEIESLIFSKDGSHSLKHKVQKINISIEEDDELIEKEVAIG